MFGLKFLNRILPPVMNEVFIVKPSAPFFLVDKNELYNRNPKSVTYGIKSVKLRSGLRSTSRNKKL